MGKPWKLGTGVTYTALSGFTWPVDGAGEAQSNPAVFDRPIQKLNKNQPLPTRDTPQIIAQGTGAIPTALSGIFYSKSNFDSFIKRAGRSEVDDDGDVIDMVQRLYFEKEVGAALTEYVYVKNGSAKLNRNAVNPLGYAYTANFQGVDPFVYSDSPTEYASGVGASTRTASGVANLGDSYVFPSFEIENQSAGSSITSLDIDYAGLTMTWSGTLPTGSTLRIVQEFDETTGVYGFYSYIGSTYAGAIGGDRMVLQESAAAKSFVLTFVGGTSGADFTVIVQKRRWG